MPTTVTQKSQVTLPKEVREGAGIRPGMRVNVTLENGRAVVEPVDEAEAQAARGEAMRARIDRYLATHAPVDWGMTTDEFMAAIRPPVPL